MRCKEWEERVALQAGGDLSAGEAAAVDRHMAQCSACREFSSELRLSLESLREAHREPIAEAHLAAVRARVMARIPERGRWRWAWLSGLAAAVAMALLALALRPARLAELPRIAVRIPPAPVQTVAAVRRATQVRRPTPPRQTPPPATEPAEPLVVKLISDDPNVVIYWIADRRGEADR